MKIPESKLNERLQVVIRNTKYDHCDNMCMHSLTIAEICIVEHCGLTLLLIFMQ